MDKKALPESAPQDTVDLSDYEGDSLAETLLVRMGLETPESVKRLRDPGRRAPTTNLRTPDEVLAALQDTTQRMIAGEIGAPEGRAILYGLQTLLVAMRMKRDDEGPAQAYEIPRLQAATDRAQIVAVLLDLMNQTLEDNV